MQQEAPAWSSYADEVLQRLSWSLSRMDMQRYSAYGRDEVRIAPEAEPTRSKSEGDPPVQPEVDPVPKLAELDELDIGWLDADFPPTSSKGASAENPADEEPERLQPSAVQVSLALRLAATLGTRDALLRCLEPGAITVLGEVAPREVKPLAELLRLAFLPPGYRIASKASQVRRASRKERPDILCLAPETDGDGISGHERRQFHRRIAEALELAVPMLILQPDEAAPDGELAGYLPAPIRLAPVDRRIMRAHLRLAYAGTGAPDDAALLDALPPESALASLTDIPLQVALRAPDAVEAARRLGRFLRPGRPRDKGPRLEDIAGSGEALAAARQLVADLALWRAKKLAWSDLCRSLLLYGRPGTGKTWLARAMGRSAGVDFIATSFAEWQAAGHLGDMLRVMRRSFADARNRAPSILFIDEIDAVGSREDDDRHNRSYRHQVINGFLELMDTVSREEGVIVVGACNHPDRIDPAVLRAGRFDLKIEVPLPDAAAILGILRRSPGDGFGEEELRDLARMATGSSAAEVDAGVRKARALARAEGRDLRFDDLRAQFSAGVAADTAWAWRAAVHECGHAIVGTVLDCGEVVRVGLSHDGGTTSRKPAGPQSLLEDIEDELAFGLAGRAAERMVFGNVCAGSGGPEVSDLAQATRMAVGIDTLFGLGVYGPVWIDTPPEVILRDPEARGRVRSRLEAAEERAGRILAAHRPHLEAMARVLLRERLLAGEALAAWLAPLKADRKDDSGKAVEPAPPETPAELLAG